VKIGVVGPLDADSFADNIVCCMPDLGHEVVALGPAGPVTRGSLGVLAEVVRRSSARGEEIYQRPLVHRLRNEKFDLIINVQQSLMPRTVLAIRRNASKVCLWYPDALSNVGRLSMISSHYDALFLKDALFVDRLRSVYGVNAHYLPEACNPHWHHPVGDSGKNAYIVVVGNIYPTRAALLRRLVSDGIPIRIYGDNLTASSTAKDLSKLHSHTRVVREGKARIFREARGVLNNLHPAEMSSVNCRLFEATASGAAVLCESRPPLRDLYEPGSEVLEFRSYRELLSQSSQLLSDATLTKQIGDAASRRARRDHTYHHRLSAMLEVLY